MSGKWKKLGRNLLEGLVVEITLRLLIILISIALSVLLTSWVVRQVIDWLKSPETARSAFPYLACSVFVFMFSTIWFYILWLRERKQHFRNERASFSSLRRDVANATTSIKIVGHACTSIFPLMQEYEKAVIERGVVIKVLLMNPDDTVLMDFQTHLEEEELPYLLRYLNLAAPDLSDLIIGIASLPRKYITTRIPILLSLVHGWGKLKALAATSITRSNNLQLSVYSSPYMIKATIIDENICYMSSFNAPDALGIDNNVRVLRGKRNVQGVSELFDTLNATSSTKHLTMGDLERYREDIERLTTRYHNN